MPPFAQWLKDARASQRMPGNGRPWTQDYFLATMKAETGWAPSYAPYNKLEQGKSMPRPETRERLEAFWASKGVQAPDPTPPAPVLSLEERAVIAAERQADAAEAASDLATALRALVEELGEMRKERQALATKVEELSAVVDQLVAADLDRRGSEGPPARGARRPTGAAGR